MEHFNVYTKWSLTAKGVFIYKEYFKPPPPPAFKINFPQCCRLFIANDPSLGLVVQCLPRSRSPLPASRTRSRGKGAVCLQIKWRHVLNTEGSDQFLTACVTAGYNQRPSEIDCCLDTSTPMALSTRENLGWPLWRRNDCSETFLLSEMESQPERLIILASKV